jgi:hypothetical protein
LLSTASFQLICGVAIASEYLRNYLDGDGSEVKHVVTDGSLKLRQDDIHFRLGLSSSDLRARLTVF